MSAGPPLRVVNLAGMTIGFVPYHWAMIAGSVVQTGAKSGIRILSKTITDRYLRTANLHLFKPRGLSVRICTAAAMQHLVRRGWAQQQQWGGGRHEGGGGLLRRSIGMLAGAGEARGLGGRLGGSSGQRFDDRYTIEDRRGRQGGLIGVLAGAAEARVLGGRIDANSGDPSSGRSDRRSDRRQARKDRHNKGGLVRGIMGTLLVTNRGGTSADHGGGILARGAGGRDADLLEYRKSSNVLWVVIMSSDMDQDIHGIEMAESHEDEERIDERTWQAEMSVEREELEVNQRY
ncbi:hypothetical protein B0H14DRAFT_3433854 [Mycena olivaceomarginata]|nr:hypothetical protein B0H14DRAFT_3433854 [Mycena olivaceomarginata]